jgi:DNA repair photolyase
MNLYRGCQHQCIYCDSRSECYRIENFANIEVKENAIGLLRNELRKIKTKDTIGTGSMNDPYMPVENEVKLTRQALESIYEFRFPVHVLTKSDLVCRDIDILKKISKTFATVSFTITAADDNLSLKLEPQAPPSSQRFTALKKLRDAGINAGILMMPMLPYITDNEENIRQIVEKAKAAGAQYILPAFGVTLRDRQKIWFFERLQEMDEKVFELYTKYYKGQYSFNSPVYHKLNAYFMGLCQRYNLSHQAPAYQGNENQQLSIFE